MSSDVTTTTPKPTHVHTNPCGALTRTQTPNTHRTHTLTTHACWCRSLTRARARTTTRDFSTTSRRLSSPRPHACGNLESKRDKCLHPGVHTWPRSDWFPHVQQEERSLLLWRLPPGVVCGQGCQQVRTHGIKRRVYMKYNNIFIKSNKRIKFVNDWLPDTSDRSSFPRTNSDFAAHHRIHPRTHTCVHSPALSHRHSPAIEMDPEAYFKKKTFHAHRPHTSEPCVAYFKSELW